MSRDALWNEGHDESVEVNQRALIDKVLARYSGEFTVFRELLQNSDDAQSKSVEIHFESTAETGEDGKLPDLKTALCQQWVFRNDGIPFRKEDWDRLKKIAEGNPDEDKIGAFGVGFYSLFSITEIPLVKSGNEWMGFYWRDNKESCFTVLCYCRDLIHAQDQLYARRGVLPEVTNYTSFEMPLREPMPMPMAFDFARFLCSSITFMTYLSEVSVYFNKNCLVRLHKQSLPLQSLGLPKGLKGSSPTGHMLIAGLNSRPVDIQATIMRWVYAAGSVKPKPIVRPQEKMGGSILSWFGLAGTPQRVATPLPPPPEEPLDLLSTIQTSVSLSIFSADVSVRLDKTSVTELHRATKKNPPTKLKYELIYTAKNQYDASKQEDQQQSFATGSVFQGLRADLDGEGSTRIFIGHATGQTTGLAGHMSARFIPTVERESIDLMDRHVASWNRDLLWVGGYLSRAAYEREFNQIRDEWTAIKPGSPLDKVAELRKLEARSLHTLRFMTFHPSTPSAEVSQLLQNAFFECGPRHFLLMSTVGVREASAIRYPDPTFAFLKDLPVIPSDVLTDAGRMVQELLSRKMIRNISFQDVISALNAGPLSEDDMVACLNWWAKTYSANPSNSLLAIRTELLTAAVLLLGDHIIPLSTIKHFLNPRSLIPSDGPLPPNLLPVAISKHLTSTSLNSAFPWTELSITDWLRYACSPQVCGPSAPVEFNLTLSAPWSERVLTLLGAAWPSLSNQTKAEVAGILKDIQCIPTSGGLKTPGESYFLKADLFHDLPVVTLASGTTLKPSVERLLADLGVRKHVDLQVVFTRMIKTQEWSIFELSRYLCDVRADLKPAEWARLKMTAAFPKETKTSEERTQCCAKDLYEPLEVFRQLGLPVLDWGQHKWRPTSDQAKILFDLGLLRFPPLDLLINLCAGSNQQIRTFALKYLVDNLATRYPNYDPGDFYEIAYLPALKDNKPIMGSPKDVFINADYAVFGVYLVFAQPSDVALKLKVQQHPSTARIVTLLESTAPQSEAEARKWFGTLAGRISDFSNAELKRLSIAPIVPTQSKDEKVTSMRWLPPNQCFFGTTAKAAFHSKMFVFVDFGTAANGFLSACGTKDSPSIEQVTQMLLAEPAGIFKMAEGVANYLDFLRSIAVNHRQLSSATIARMKKASILLGSTRKPASGDTDYDDDNPIEQYDLKRGDEIVVADDNNALQNFGEYLFVAPQEDILEEFYLLLGSRRLSGLVKEDYKTTAELKGTQLPAQIRSLILERLPLFLHEHTHARTRVSFSWLNNEAHFIVTSFGKLSVTKSLTFGTIRKSKTQEASAVAKRAGSGPIHLWIAGNSQVDMYEVATSLNRLLFDSPKTNDALLFMTILSTDLKALKRRGYNVDRILKHQNAIRQAALEEQAKKAQLIAKPPAPTLPTIPTSTTSPLPLPPQQDAQNAPPPPEKSRPLSNMMSTFKKRFNTTTNTQEKVPVAPPIPEQTRPRPPSKSVTPRSHIQSNIDMAIRACRPESGNLLQNREQMQQVNESLNEGYCDISGRVGDLIAVGDISGVKVFVSQEVPDPHTFMPLKYEPLTRLAPIMKGLAEVYSLPLASLHIFYDLDGGLIAFNRNGSIFLNLRYYEAWHDAEVKAGSTRTAYISWFHTLAHELAHNLVGPHNSEHEFWFSSICERYFGQMANRLAL